jgi:hypothetical protein
MMSNFTGNAHDTLVCSLRLLFDGKKGVDIGKAVGEALKGHSSSWTFLSGFEFAQGLYTVYAIDAEWVWADLYEGEDGWFVGTEDDLELAARQAATDDLGDYTYESLRASLRDNCEHYLKGKFIAEEDAIEAAAEDGVELNL